MPIDYKKYPANWKSEIRPAILERANHRCERCGVENYAIGLRDLDGKFWTDEEYFDMGWDEIDRLFGYKECKTIRIVLTIAHIDNPDPMDCRPENLQALCQRCHILLDAPEKGRKRKEKNRIDRDRAVGQLDMFRDGI